MRLLPRGIKLHFSILFQICIVKISVITMEFGDTMHVWFMVFAENMYGIDADKFGIENLTIKVIHILQCTSYMSDSPCYNNDVH